MATNLKWDNAQERSGPSRWDTTIYKWSDAFLLLEIINDAASSPEILWNVQQLEPDKKRQFVRLICKVKGIETYSGQKTIRDDIEITVDDVELVVKEVLGIDLTVENIHV